MSYKLAKIQSESKGKCLPGHSHIYEIIKGSGANSYTPKWKCKICGNIVKSN
jgi:hypothetical protein